MVSNKRRMNVDTSNMIFVFGSNTGGIHGAGAARFAYENRGAKIGVGYGMAGQSFAIPTKGVHRQKRRGESRVTVGDTLPLLTIQRYVEDFLRQARKSPEIQFQVTCIGCGLAGLRHEDVAPMFANDDIDNLWFDELWRPILGDGYRYWGSF